MRALIAGTGSAGRRHLANLEQSSSTFEITLLRRSGEPDDVSRRFDANIVTSLSDALSTKPDLAIVATPSALHAAVLEPLLREGISTYVEKPAVVTKDELERIQALDPPVPTMSGCNLRFLPSLRAVHAMLSEGRVGKLVRATFTAGQWLPDWRPDQDYRSSYSAKRDLGGGVILDLVHELDCARWLLGELEVECCVARKVSSLEIETEDTASITLSQTGEHGALVTVNLDYVARKPIRRYELVGEDGTIVWDLASRQVLVEKHGSTEPLELETKDFDVAATYVETINEFLGAVEAGRETTQPLAEGLATAGLAIRAREMAGL